MKTRLAATQTQSQTLNAQVLQSIRLLGLTGLELEQELAEALAQNPMLEREEDEPAAGAPEPAPQDRAAQEAAAFDELPEFPLHASAGRGFDPDEAEDRMARIAAPLSNDPALRVLEGLAMELKPQDLAIAAAWLERTADSGYLVGDREALDAEISAAFALRPGRAEAIRQRLLHGVLALGIEGARRLIQEEHGRVAQDGARDGDALRLPAAEQRPPLPNRRVVALRQLHDEVVSVGSLGGSAHLLIGGLWATHADVLGDSSVEEVGLL